MSNFNFRDLLDSHLEADQINNELESSYKLQERYLGELNSDIQTILKGNIDTRIKNIKDEIIDLIKSHQDDLIAIFNMIDKGKDYNALIVNDYNNPKDEYNGIRFYCSSFMKSQTELELQLYKVYPYNVLEHTEFKDIEEFKGTQNDAYDNLIYYKPQYLKLIKNATQGNEPGLNNIQKDIDYIRELSNIDAKIIDASIDNDYRGNVRIFITSTGRIEFDNLSNQGVGNMGRGWFDNNGVDKEMIFEELTQIKEILANDMPKLMKPFAALLTKDLLTKEIENMHMRKQISDKKNEITITKEKLNALKDENEERDYDER